MTPALTRAEQRSVQSATMDPPPSWVEVAAHAAITPPAEKAAIAPAAQARIEEVVIAHHHRWSVAAAPSPEPARPMVRRTRAREARALGGLGLFAQPAPKGLRHRGRTVGGAELLADVLHVGLDGVGRDGETLGDVPVRVAERE